MGGWARNSETWQPHFSRLLREVGWAYADYFFEIWIRR
jgi:hypothetical protein